MEYRWDSMGIVLKGIRYRKRYYLTQMDIIYGHFNRENDPSTSEFRWIYSDYFQTNTAMDWVMTTNVQKGCTTEV